MPFQYYVYGLHVQSEIACPELPSDPDAPRSPDVTIQVLSPASGISETLENGYFEVRPGVFRLAVKDVAQYLVEGGSRIVVEPSPDAPPETVRLFLLGSTMGALLYQRGLFPLHGCAIETEWGTMIFVGPQGVGKSTLAASFHRRGYRLLSDDVCAVAMTPEGLQVLPAPAHFRLCADAYERFGTPSDAQFNVDKFVVPMQEGYCPDPVPLRAVHVLGEHEDAIPKFELVQGFDRVRLLLENLYRPQYLRGQSTQASLMRMAAQIAGKTPVMEVLRRRDPEKIDAFVDFLNSAWTSHFNVGHGQEKNLNARV